jgi:hypothetical protein
MFEPSKLFVLTVNIHLEIGQIVPHLLQIFNIIQTVYQFLYYLL